MIPARTRTLPCTMRPKHSTTNQSESGSPRVCTTRFALSRPPHPPCPPRPPRPQRFPLPFVSRSRRSPLCLGSLTQSTCIACSCLGTDGDPYPQAVTRAGPARCDVRETIRTTTRLAASTASVLVSHVHTIISQKSAVHQICSPSRP